MVLRRIGRELGLGDKRKEPAREEAEASATELPDSESKTTPADHPPEKSIIEEPAASAQVEQVETPAEPQLDAPSEAAVPVASEEIYVVQSGDSLSAIAQRFYGDAGAYMRIFEANRHKLGSPDVIHPGQEFVIPR